MPKKKDAVSGFGGRLTAFRKAAGYTQVQLAQTVGISQRMMAYYENTADFRVSKVIRGLARTLGVTTDELLGATPVKNAPIRKTDSGARKKR